MGAEGVAVGRSVAGPNTKRRRSAFFGRPATQIGHWIQKTSQVSKKTPTCDVFASDLRHFGLHFRLKVRNWLEFEQVHHMLAVNESLYGSIFTYSGADILVQNGISEAQVVFI